MKRRPFNVFSLVFGVILILLAAWIAFPTRGWLFGTPQWLLPAAVILVGAALMSPLFTSREGNTRSPGESSAVEQYSDVSRTPPGEASTPDRPADELDGASSSHATKED